MRTLLVANRGEIALRVIRSARARGLRTVAVYSDADRGAPHVRAADAAVHIGPTPATVVVPLDRARSSRPPAPPAPTRSTPATVSCPSERNSPAPSSRPGSSSSGPSGDVMDAMGRKDRAREIAERAGVPVVPRRRALGGRRRRCERSSFPVLVKAAAGGGGKGMRVVRDPADLRRRARRGPPRGRVGLRRRHPPRRAVRRARPPRRGAGARRLPRQRRPPVRARLLGPAPPPEGDRGGAGARPRPRRPARTLLDSAVALAREVGYDNAGTVEFLVDRGPRGRGASTSSR